jgi:putative ABC transport system permease protein
MGVRVRPHPPPARTTVAGAGPALTSLVWTKAPLLLARFPAVLAAVVAAAAVLGAAAASRQLFLSAVGTASLRTELSDASPYAAGLTLTTDGPVTPGRVAYRSDLARRAVGGIGGLAPLVVTVVWPSVRISVPDRPDLDFTVAPATRTGSERHIEITSGDPATAPRDGWWVPDSAARVMAVGPGDTVRVELPGETVIDLPVAGTYVDLWRLPPEDFWEPIDTRFIRGSGGALSELPPPLMLTELEPFLALVAPTAPEGHMRWEVPVEAADVTLPQAERLAGQLERVRAGIDDPRSLLGAAIGEHGSGLGDVTTRSRSVVSGLAGPVDAIALAGLLVGLGVFVAAGIYGMQHRRTEYGTLAARGLGPLALGGRSVLEALVPAAVGAALGWAGAYLLVRRTGPAELLAEEAVRGSIRDAAVACAAAVVLLGVAVGMAVQTAGRPPRGRLASAASRIPWELAALALAGAALVQIWTAGEGAAASSLTTAAAPDVDLLLPLFPILFLAGAGGLGVRALHRAAPRLRSAGRGWRAAWYLAGRRLASAPRGALALVTVAILAVGIVSYGGVFVSSARATADRKAQVAVGSDASIGMNGPVELPAEVEGRTTTVARESIATLEGTDPVTVLAIDPRTFERAAYWDDGFADQSLAELLERLASGSGDRLPVIAVNGPVPADGTLEVFGRIVETTVVARSHHFPGMPAGTMLVAPMGPLERLLDAPLQNFRPAFQIWVRGDHRPVQAALEAEGFLPGAVSTASEIRSTPRFRSLSWVFGFLQALGILVGTIAAVALLLYLQSRQRAREVSYALATRMGLSRRSHRRSVGAELAGMLVVAFVLGAGLATLSAAVVNARTDVLPGLPPGPLLRIPWPLFGAIALALALVATAGAWAVQRRADRANIAEVMRLAG